jgi:hypothetical protein
MSGGGGPTQSTTVTSNIPEWLKPQVTSLIGGATQQIFNVKPNAETGQFDINGVAPFVPYSANPADYVAGFSPLQTQAQVNAANLQVPGQYGQASQLAGAAGVGGMQSADQAYGFGTAGYNAGMQGLAQGQYAAQQSAQDANALQNAAYGYGGQGQQSGLTGQNLAVSQGQNLKDQALFYGSRGRQIGEDQGGNLVNQAAYYGQQAAGLAPAAQMYGQNAADIGQMGLNAQYYGQNVGNQAQNYAAQAANAGANYANQITNPYAVQQYMNPYAQNVIDVQNQAAQRQADIASTQRGANAAKAGAFGGSRQAIENAEANRALQSLMNTNQATGLNTAYNNAIQNMQYGSNLNLQGLQGAQQGLGTALQGGQLGLSGIGTAMQGQQAGISGLNAANQFYGTGLQGVNAGVQGVNTQLAGQAQGLQGVNTGLQAVNTQLAGTAQGMQGAGVGLQGVGQATNAGQYALQGAGLGLQGTAQGMQGAGVGLQGVGAAQSGYGLGNTAASNLGNLGQQQLAAQTGIIGLQNQVGAQQQQAQQDIINNAINNYAQAQNYPLQQYNAYNAILRGYAIPGQTSTTYQAAPALSSQLAGLGTAGYGLSQLAKGASGGLPKDFKTTRVSGLDTLGLYNATRG